jgi:hypothetical protein
MIETKDGEIVFALSRSASGRDWEKLFGLGRIYSLERLAKKLARDMAKAIASQVR